MNIVFRYAFIQKMCIRDRSIAADRKNLRVLRCAMKKAGILDDGRYYLCTDMEEGKTWLVSDHS